MTLERLDLLLRRSVGARDSLLYFPYRIAFDLAPPIEAAIL